MEDSDFVVRLPGLQESADRLLMSHDEHVYLAHINAGMRLHLNGPVRQLKGEELDRVKAELLKSRKVRR